MNLPQDIQELLEQYLNGQLQGDALRDFEAQIAADKALAAEVAFQREMQAFLADTPENELRKTLQMLSDQVVEPKEEEGRGWFWWLFPAGDSNVLDWLFGHPARHLAWVLPLLLVAGWWMFNRNGIEITDPPIAGTDTLEHKQDIKNIDTSGIIAASPLAPLEDTIQQTPIMPRSVIPKNMPKEASMPIVLQETFPEPSIETVPNIIPHLESVSDSEIVVSLTLSGGVSAITPTKTYDFFTPPTIYWYNSEVEPKIDFFDPTIYFGPSPLFDSLVVATKQDSNYNIELLDGPAVIYLAENISRGDSTYQKVPLRLIIETEKDLFQEDPVLYVRDNQGNPYGPFPLIDSIQLEGENRYIVQTQIPLWDNSPRLVYYSIEDYTTKKPYFVDKVAVLPKDSIFEKKDFPFNGAIVLMADQSLRTFAPDKIPDFFAPDARLEAAIAQNTQSDDFRISIQPAIPDTFYIPDSFFVYDANLPDSIVAAQKAYKDKIFNLQLTVHTTENLFEKGLNYKTWDNVDFLITQNYDSGYAIKKKYGTNAYFLDIQIGYAEDYPEGLYYYQIVAGSQTFTGKYVILPVGSRQ